MTRWSICLCAVLFVVSCTSDGGPGTESPGGGVGGTGGNGGEGESGAGGGSGAAGAAAGGLGGAGGVAGVGGGQGGAGGMSGQGGTGGEDTAGMDGGVPTDDDAGADDEGYCTVACTGVAPDEGVSEACGAIMSSDDCTTFETGSFPPGCRWVTPASEPCLAP